MTQHLTATAAVEAVAIVLALLMSSAAMAQQRIYYGADGRVSARESTGSDRSTTLYGADGRATARTSTDSTGTTTTYDAHGRRIGTVTTTKPREQAR